MASYVDVELDLDEETIAFLHTEAQKRNISIDDLVNEILKEEIAKYEKRIWKENLPENLDSIMEDISLNGAKYFICEDETLTYPTAVLMGIKEYEAIQEVINKE